jgi:hypothetical protein
MEAPQTSKNGITMDTLLGVYAEELKVGTQILVHPWS